MVKEWADGKEKHSGESVTVKLVRYTTDEGTTPEEPGTETPEEPQTPEIPETPEEPENPDDSQDDIVITIYTYHSSNSYNNGNSVTYSIKANYTKAVIELKAKPDATPKYGISPSTVTNEVPFAAGAVGYDLNDTSFTIDIPTDATSVDVYLCDNWWNKDNPTIIISNVYGTNGSDNSGLNYHGKPLRGSTHRWDNSGRYSPCYSCRSRRPLFGDSPSAGPSHSCGR